MSIGNEPAFPVTQTKQICDSYNGKILGGDTFSEGGLTKRELLSAIMFHGGTISTAQVLGRDVAKLSDDEMRRILVRGAIKDADALLAELAKETE